jgi:Ca2+-binding RTX toxin-like protein
MEYDLAATTVGWEPLGSDEVSAQFTYTNLAGLTLLGGSGGNTIRVLDLPAASFTLEGGAGINTLDYSGFVGDIVVDLPLGSATGFTSIVDIQNVAGSVGNDILVGDGNANVLVGGTGRNLIIGGVGAQLLVGGGADNILIAGATIYDANLIALEAIMLEWSRMDLSYDERVAELSDPGFEYALTADAVFADQGTETVPGGGQDWIFS